MTASETTVLLVDDVIECAMASKRLLETVGHRVTIVHSVSAARAYIANWQTTNFAIVMLDQLLGDGLGTDLFPDLSVLMPSPGVGVYSGSLDCALVRKACEAGAIAFPRPHGLTDLEEIIGYLKVGGVLKHPSVHRELTPNCERVFGRFCLKGVSLVTPKRVLELLPKSAALLAYLVDHRTAWASVSDIALSVFARKPELQGGPQLVYHHNYALKRELGEYDWLVESRRNVGYRLAPAALLSKSELEHANGSQLRSA